VNEWGNQAKWPEKEMTTNCTLGLPSLFDGIDNELVELVVGMLRLFKANKHFYSTIILTLYYSKILFCPF
jgi:hypothetical protein